MLPNPERLALVSLEALSLEPAATMDALYTFLQLPLHSLVFPARNVHAESHACQKQMQTQLDARVAMYFRKERWRLASALQRFAPGKLPLPTMWRRFLRPVPNISDDATQALLRQPMKPLTAQVV